MDENQKRRAEEVKRLREFRMTPGLNFSWEPQPRPYNDAAFSAAPDARGVREWLVEIADIDSDAVVGQDEALASLRSAILAPIEAPELFAHYNMKPSRGGLLYGPPGCGKTLFAKVVAAEVARHHSKSEGAKILCVAAADLMDKYWGETERKIRAIYDYARDYRKHYGHPLIVFIDEADGLFAARGTSNSFSSSALSTFLSCLDGMKENAAFTLLATNRPEALDPALTRPGRCDFRCELLRPDRAALEEILRRNLRSMPRAPGYSLEDLVFAGIESIFDPEKIVIHADVVRSAVRQTPGGLEHRPLRGFVRDLTFDEIVSGATAAMIPQRAGLLAFERDRASGTRTGLKQIDILNAVRAVFEEQREAPPADVVEAFHDRILAENERLNSQENSK